MKRTKEEVLGELNDKIIRMVIESIVSAQIIIINSVDDMNNNPGDTGLRVLNEIISSSLYSALSPICSVIQPVILLQPKEVLDKYFSADDFFTDKYDLRELTDSFLIEYNKYIVKAENFHKSNNKNKKGL